MTVPIFPHAAALSQLHLTGAVVRGRNVKKIEEITPIIPTMKIVLWVLCIEGLSIVGQKRNMSANVCGYEKLLLRCGGTILPPPEGSSNLDGGNRVWFLLG